MTTMKVGFPYYNVDTDRYQDIRIKRLKNHYNTLGVAVYDYLLCEIYRDKGYYLPWDEARRFDVADYFSLPEEKMNELVSYCAEIGLFSQEILSKESVLTSASIQRRYCEMAFRARRKKPQFAEEYRLFTEESTVFAEKERQITTNGPKVKKSKEKESKEKKDLKENACKNLFELFRQLYPGDKRGLDTEYENFRRKHPDYREAVKLLQPAIEQQIQWRKQREALREFTPQYPQLQTWINQRRWEVELEKTNSYEEKKQRTIVD